MFYNAMKRKGYSPSEKDMDVVVPIHNMVNEQAWVQVCKYEKLHQVYILMLIKGSMVQSQRDQS